MNLKIVKGNIVNSTADAIVLPANTQLKEGPGASAAIFQAAGKKELTAACKKIGHCEVGAATATLAYNLPSKYIIHAVVPKWNDGKHHEYALLSSAYISSMQAADMLEAESIAFPLLASGNNGFDVNVAFEIAEKSITSYDAKHVKEAVLVLFSENLLSLAENAGYEWSVLPEHINMGLIKERKGDTDITERKAVGIVDALKTYWNNEKNREKIFNAGLSIATAAINAVLFKGKKKK